jgi:phytoene desaturase
MSKKVIVIGSGFSGLSSAIALADKGYQVTVLEKNDSLGGRARVFKANGFTFDMGPSWYWMPDVFESFFAKFGKKVSDYYHLHRLDPSYAVYFSATDKWDIPANMSELENLFESYEPGAAVQLRKFLADAKYKYDKGINDLVHKPSLSITEFIDIKLWFDVLRLDIFQSIHKQLRKYFKHPHILKLMEFPVLFLGAKPENTPALYSLMNYADIALGTWYPMGGMYHIVDAMVNLAKEKGVVIIPSEEVTKIEVANGNAKSVVTTTQTYTADIVVASADYHHVDQILLEQPYRNYSPEYWDKRVMAPSSLLFYVGVNKRIKALKHHNLFFDEDFQVHAQEIYDTPNWPSKPLFYVSAPSVTDPSVAPEGYENLFFLIPIAPGLSGDNEQTREKYFDIILTRLEKAIGENISEHIVYKRSYAQTEFMADYHAFKGNAYGLANTLMQTAILKPSIKNKKVSNLFYTGQLTVPGPGVPPSLISGLVVADQIEKEFRV